MKKSFKIAIINNWTRMWNIPTLNYFQDTQSRENGVSETMKSLRLAPAILASHPPTFLLYSSLVEAVCCMESGEERRQISNFFQKKFILFFPFHQYILPLLECYERETIDWNKCWINFRISFSISSRVGWSRMLYKFYKYK